MGIHLQNIEEIHLRNRQEKGRDMYDESGRFVMEIMSYEVDV